MNQESPTPPSTNFPLHSSEDYDGSSFADMADVFNWVRSPFVLRGLFLAEELTFSRRSGNCNFKEMAARLTIQLFTDRKRYSARQKAHKQDITMVALDLVNWVCLISWTAWTSVPCLCKIHPIELEDAHRLFVLDSSLSSHRTSVLCW